MDEKKITNREKFYILLWIFIIALVFLVLSIIVEIWDWPNKTYTFLSLLMIFISFYYIWLLSTVKEV